MAAIKRTKTDEGRQQRGPVKQDGYQRMSLPAEVGEMLAAPGYFLTTRLEDAEDHRAKIRRGEPVWLASSPLFPVVLSVTGCPRPVWRGGQRGDGRREVGRRHA